MMGGRGLACPVLSFIAAAVKEKIKTIKHVFHFHRTRTHNVVGPIAILRPGYIYTRDMYFF
jgi:hypothetical protein